jgi:hypothetical protein
MAESRRRERIPLDRVLDAFSGRGDSHEPLTTREVATDLDCSRRTAYNKLDALASRGDLKTKKVGARGRVWWIPDGGAGEVGPVGDHVVELEFRSEALAEPFVAASDGNVRLSIDSVISLPDETHLQYYTVSGISRRTYLDTVEEFSNTFDTRLLSTVGDTFRVERHTTAESIAPQFVRFGGEIKSGVVEEGAFTVVGEFPATVDTAALLEAIREIHPDVELVAERRLMTPTLLRDVLEGDLTERQLTALRAAYFAGYFRRPRDSTGADLADRMGITKQTFHHHLRKAEESVFRQIFEEVDRDSTSDQSV